MARIQARVKVFDSRDVLVGEGWTFESDTGRDADCVLIRWHDSDEDWCRYTKSDFHDDLDLQRFTAEFHPLINTHDVAVMLFVVWLILIAFRRV